MNAMGEIKWVLPLPLSLFSTWRIFSREKRKKQEKKRLTTSPANHVHFSHVLARKNRQMENGLKSDSGYSQTKV
jgi:hypothetical protein